MFSTRNMYRYIKISQQHYEVNIIFPIYKKEN